MIGRFYWNVATRPWRAVHHQTCQRSQVWHVLRRWKQRRTDTHLRQR